MRGFKALNWDLTNRYGFQYEIGVKYKLNGNLIWRENGFNFCTNPEDTLRYVDAYNEDIVFTLVEGSGELVLYEDEYYGFYDMYASSKMKILRIVSRHEVFEMIMESNNIFRVKRYASLMKLTLDEKREILKKYPSVKSTIDYYQSDEYILKRKLGD